MPDQRSTRIALVVQDIVSVRGRRVLLDSTLAALYDATTKRLNEQVRRNIGRFPADFLIHLTLEEYGALRSHSATLKTGRGEHRKYPPLAFTEHGAIMAAMVLNSPRAIEMSVLVVRAFVCLREALASNAAMADKLAALERAVNELDARTQQEFSELYRAIKELLAPKTVPQRDIGFLARWED